MTTLFFFHGLESRPHGSKYRALCEIEGVTVTAPDFQGLNTVAERLALAVEATEGLTGLILVGSSFGGLVAALLADKYPERVAGYVLCAPAVHRPEAHGITRVPLKAAIIHGEQDEIISIGCSMGFAAWHNIPLQTVEDGHRLEKSLPEIIAAVRSIL